MPLAQISHIPQDHGGLDWWAFHHDQQHRQIVQALNAKFGLSLNTYILYPLNMTDLSGWLNRHQQAHNDMDEALNYNGADLSSLDFDDDRKVRLFEWLNFQEHSNAAGILSLA
jgi:hypothetical protein